MSSQVSFSDSTPSYSVWGQTDGLYERVVAPVAAMVTAQYGLEETPGRVMVCRYWGPRGVSMAGTCLGHVLGGQQVTKFSVMDECHKPEIWAVGVIPMTVADAWPVELAGQEVAFGAAVDALAARHADVTERRLRGEQPATVPPLHVGGGPFSTMVGPKGRATATVLHLLGSTAMSTQFETYHRVDDGRVVSPLLWGQITLLTAAMGRLNMELIPAGTIVRGDLYDGNGSLRPLPPERHGEIKLMLPDRSRKTMAQLNTGHEPAL